MIVEERKGFIRRTFIPPRITHFYANSDAQRIEECQISGRHGAGKKIYFGMTYIGEIAALGTALSWTLAALFMENAVSRVGVLP